MRVSGIKQSHHFYESLYVSVEPDPVLLNLRTSLMLKFKIPRLEWNPHISLHYGDTSSAKKQKLISELQDHLPSFFEVKYLWLAWVDEKAERWEILDEVELDGAYK